MASYHCTIKIGGKGKATAHANYITRSGKYQKKEGHEDLEASGYGNLPPWANNNPTTFWETADTFERTNGTTYREIEIALPRELTPAQRQTLLQDFIHQQIGTNHAYQWAIHCPKAAIEQGEQPHAHLLYSERMHDHIQRPPEQYFKRYNPKNPDQGGCKKDSAGTQERLLDTRERWATLQNHHLQQHGHTSRVDHRSLADQGIDRPPERHLGPTKTRLLTPQHITQILERRIAEGEQERAQDLVHQTIDLSQDLPKALAARQHHLEKQQQREIVRTMAKERAQAYRQNRAAQKQQNQTPNRTNPSIQPEQPQTPTPPQNYPTPAKRDHDDIDWSP